MTFDGPAKAWDALDRAGGGASLNCFGNGIVSDGQERKSQGLIGRRYDRDAPEDPNCDREQDQRTNAAKKQRSGASVFRFFRYQGANATSDFSTLAPPQVDAKRTCAERLSPKAKMKEHGVTYTGLVARLKAYGFEETEASITMKLKRGTFAATFMFACVAALEIEGVKLDEIQRQEAEGLKPPGAQSSTAVFHVAGAAFCHQAAIASRKAGPSCALRAAAPVRAHVLNATVTDANVRTHPMAATMLCHGRPPKRSGIEQTAG
jgi:hypothetical protein